ncbi:2-dehydropantoate 2-reductase [Salinicola sp. RZ23]|uniref:ketopantoate reductase family protein n=1 Tax=Salinicola sp. RZ23 TaxID=1949087 RepID=UPI000DA1FA6E|nr:2-dehydropantoate 2-reductase [Salinicola sp. RZ23]
MTAAPWLVLGAGALGQLFAARLAAADDIGPIALRGRHGLLNQLRLQETDGSWRSLALASPEAPPALVIVATKAPDAEQALQQAQLAPGTPLLLLQNGFSVQPRLSAQWPGPVLCAATTEAAYRQPPPAIGVVHAAAGHTWLGDLAARHLALAETVAAILTRVGLAASACDDIDEKLWHKLAVNAVINPLTARHRVLNGALAEPQLSAEVAALCAEIAQLMAAAKVPPPAAGWQGWVGAVIEATAGNRSSMLQDVLAGRGTERDAILQPLLALADTHALAVPRLRACYRATPA